MSDSIQISVVIPAFNEQDYVARAIDSVLAQSLQPAEIIVVDDGSTDKTADVIRQYGGKVNYVYQPNAGLAAARNTGIRESCYDYIAFLDSDDEWTKNHLKAACQVFEENPGLVWYCASYERINVDGSVEFTRHVPEHFITGGKIRDYFFVEASEHFSLPSCMIIKRERLIVLKGFDERVGQYGEDLDMWFRIALRDPEIGYSNDVGVRYWARPGSMMSGYKVNIERFLRRIQITEAASLREGLEARERSSVLISDWVTKAFKESVKQGNTDALKYILRYYKWGLPLKWRLTTAIFCPLSFLMARR